MAYFVEFTSGDDSELIAELSDKTEAVETGTVKQAGYKAAGKRGIISCYEITAERGIPMRKCYWFWEV